MKSRDYQVGELIAGAYRVLRVFGGTGESGMGVVYLVEGRDDPLPFVLKACQLGDPTLTSRFIREAETWVNIGGHPNVTRATWVQYLDAQLFIAAEYVDGCETGRGSVADVLGQEIPAHQILRWIVQFCSGLSHALARGLIAHRDVKPANLLLDRQGTLKIADFGLGKQEKYSPALSPGSSVAATGIAGTLPYMSPEQLRLSTTDHRCDIYAFGIVLYQLCSRGAYPYALVDSSQPVAYVNAHLHGIIRPIESPFWPLISKCIERSTSTRWQSPDELAVAANNLAKQLRLPCPPFIPPQPVGLEELYTKAASLSALGRKQEALAAIEQYLGESPDAYWAWTRKGFTLLEMDRLEDAESATLRSLTLDSGQSDAWNNLGIILNRQGRAQESCDAYERALQCDSMNTGAMMNAAQPLCTLGRFNQAAELLCRALRLAPSKQTLQFNTGNVVTLMLQGRDFQSAEKVSRALIDANPHHSQAWHNLGVLLSAIGRPQEAIENIRNAVEFEPDNLDSRFFLARLYAETGLIDEASSQIDAMATEPMRASKAVLFIAQLLVRKGRGQDGILLLENRLRRAPNDDETWFTLCSLAEHLSELRKALGAAEACQAVLQRQGDQANMDKLEWARNKVRALRASLSF